MCISTGQFFLSELILWFIFFYIVVGRFWEADFERWTCDLYKFFYTWILIFIFNKYIFWHLLQVETKHMIWDIMQENISNIIKMFEIKWKFSLYLIFFFGSNWTGPVMEADRFSRRSSTSAPLFHLWVLYIDADHGWVNKL